MQELRAQAEFLKQQEFPSKIWQTSRTYKSPGGRKEVQSWLEMNPGYRYERITQANDQAYVRETFPHDPDLLNVLFQLDDGMLRADLIQYIFLYAEGGVYTDMDTVCLTPIRLWVPEQYSKQANLVLGIEGDCQGGEIISGFSHCVQFATWTMMVKPGHFILKIILHHVSVQRSLGLCGAFPRRSCHWLKALDDRNP